jgi:HD-like signal output (HDOD) protein
MLAINDLVTATTVGNTFSGMPIQLMDVSIFWKKSPLCALLAGMIAKSCNLDDSEGFFIVGLLRDIGHLALYQTIPQRPVCSHRSGLSWILLGRGRTVQLRV